VVQVEKYLVIGELLFKSKRGACSARYNAIATMSWSTTPGHYHSVKTGAWVAGGNHLV